MAKKKETSLAPSYYALANRTPTKNEKPSGIIRDDSPYTSEGSQAFMSNYEKDIDNYNKISNVISAAVNSRANNDNYVSPTAAQSYVDATKKQTDYLSKTGDRIINYAGNKGLKGTDYYEQLKKSFDDDRSTYTRLNDSLKDYTDYWKQFSSKSEYESYKKVLAKQEAHKEEMSVYDKIRNNSDFAAKSGELSKREFAELHHTFARDSINKYLPGYNSWSDEEKQMAAYLLRTQGSDAVVEYIKKSAEDIATRRGEEIYSGIKDFWDTSESDSAFLKGVDKVGEVAANAAVSYYAGAEQSAPNIAQMFTNEKVNTYTGASKATGLAMQNAGEGSFENYIYKTTQNLGNNMPSQVVGMALGATGLRGAANVVGSGVMGLSAAGAAKADALEKGYDPSVANAYGITTGFIETLTGTLLNNIPGLKGVLPDKLLESFIPKVSTSVMRGLLRLGVSEISENIEEQCNNILENMASKYILGEDVEIFNSQEALDTLIVTSLSTLLNGGGESIYRGINENKTFDPAAYGMREDTAASLVDYAKTLDNLPGYDKRLINEADSRTSNGENITNWQYERLNDIIKEQDELKVTKAAQGYLSDQGVDNSEKLGKKVAEGAMDEGKLSGVPGRIARNITLSRAEKNNEKFKEAGGRSLIYDTNQWMKDTKTYGMTRLETIKAENIAKNREENIKSGKGYDMNESFDIKDADGNTVKATTSTIVSGENGIQARVKTDNGYVTTAIENLPEAQQKAFAQLRKDLGTEVAVAAFNNYVSGDNLAEYSADAFSLMAMGYSKAANNQNNKYVQRIKSKLGEQAFNEIVAAAQNVKAEQDRIYGEKNQKVAFSEGYLSQEGDGASLNAIDDDQFKKQFGKAAYDHFTQFRDILSQFAKEAGLHIVLGSSLDADLKLTDTAYNGKYDTGTRTIYIDVFANAVYDSETRKVDISQLTKSTMLVTASHELTHFLRNNDIATYNELMGFVFDKLSESGKFRSILSDAIGNAANKSSTAEGRFDYAMDEIVAQGCEEMFQSIKLSSEFATAHPETASKIKQWLDNFLNKMKSICSQQQFSARAEAIIMRDYAEELSEIWNRGLLNALYNHNVGHSEQEAQKVVKELNEEFYDTMFEQELHEEGKTVLDGVTYTIEKVDGGYIGKYNGNHFGTQVTGSTVPSVSINDVVDALVDKATTPKTITNEKGELVIARSNDGHTLVFSEKTYYDGGKTALMNALEAEGHTSEEIADLVDNIERELEFLKDLGKLISKEKGYEKLSKNLDAVITYSAVTHKQVLSTLTNNGDYPLNLDLSLICKKRVAYMALMNRLIADNVLSQVTYDAKTIARVNEILRKHGFETACLGCFVESRRQQFQEWAETVCNEWNGLVAKYNKNAPEFGFYKGSSFEISTEDLTQSYIAYQDKSNLNDKGNFKLGQGNSVTRMAKFLKEHPNVRKKLTVADLLTTEGLKNMKEFEPTLFSVAKSRYGAAAPKIVQDFNPYNGEVANLSYAFVKDMINESLPGSKSYKEQAKKDFPRRENESNEAYNKRIEREAIKQYCYDIGGVRIQSFSDFMIENTFDYVQIFADLAARRLPLHGYTKEQSMLRLFGMSGAKLNGSWIAHNDNDQLRRLAAEDALLEGLTQEEAIKKYAGLLPVEFSEKGKDGKYHAMKVSVEVNGVMREFAIQMDDYELNKYNKVNGLKESFIQSIGMKDMLAIQCDPRYSDYCGSITIGVSDLQIRAMLNDPRFRMVIPYHKSGMNPMFAKMLNVDTYNDYTDYQTTTVKELKDINGNVVKSLTKKDGKAPSIDKHYDFNKALQELGDAKAAAEAYKAWCAEDHPVYDGNTLIGYAVFNPKFSDSPFGYNFAENEPNYYKLLEDFNTYGYDNTTNARQGAVKMNLPSKENTLSALGLVDEYRNRLEATGVFTEKEIESYIQKGEMTFDDIVKKEINERADYDNEQAKVWESTVEEVKQEILSDEFGQRSSYTQRDENRQYRKRQDQLKTLKKKLEEELSERKARGETIRAAEIERELAAIKREREAVDAIAKLEKQKDKTEAEEDRLAEMKLAYIGEFKNESKLSDKQPSQKISSEDTSLPQTPATFTKYQFSPSDRILDYGGGKYDIAKKSMEATYPGIKFEVVDAFNRTDSHNQRIFEEFKDDKANVVTINNVLNVIGETDVIEYVIKDAKRYLADDGICYIAIYEGSKEQQAAGGKETSKGWQNFKPASWYKQFAEKYYKNVKVTGSFLICSDGAISTKGITAETKAKLKGETDSNKKNAAELYMKNSKYSEKQNGYAPKFYSQMERIIESKMPNKMSVDQVEKFLLGKGVKAEEIKWSGIKTFMEGKKSVTKDELLQFARENQIELEERTLSGKSDIDIEQGPYESEDGERFESIQSYIDHTVEMINKQLDEDDWITAEDISYFADRYENVIRIAYDYEDVGTLTPLSHKNDERWGEYKTPGGSNYREIVFKMPGSEYSNRAMKIHWDESGVIAHARIQDHTDANTGEVVMMIEEIQSDWNNAVLNNPTKENTTLETKESASGRKIYLLKNKKGAEIGRMTQTQAEEQGISENELHDYMTKKLDVPDAPYAGKASSYVPFVLKNLIRTAAEEGYGSIAWTTADMQSDRWSDEFAEGYRIEYDQEIPKFLRKYGKQWGAEVTKTELLNENGDEVWYMGITDAMRESVLYEGQSRFSEKLSPEQKVNYDYNQKNTTVGTKLKTLKGSPIARYKNTVGKEIGGQIYLHKNYINDVIKNGYISEEAWDKAIGIMRKKHPEFLKNANCVMIDKKKGTIRFDEAPDFNTAREPIPGKMITVTASGDTVEGYSDYIWHHKWLWVENDYKGFDVAESWNWSKQWLSTIYDDGEKVSNRGIANGSGHGTANWNAQLEHFGLPLDGGAKFSEKNEFQTEFRDYDHSSLNAALENGIIDKGDYAAFESFLNNVMRRNMTASVPKSKSGEYIVDTGSKLIFTDGDIYTPLISKIISFATEYEDEMSYPKELIESEARDSGSTRTAISIIKSIYGNAFVTVNYAADFRTVQRKNGRRKGKDSSTSSYGIKRAKSLRERRREEGLEYLLDDDYNEKKSEKTTENRSDEQILNEVFEDSAQTQEQKTALNSYREQVKRYEAARAKLDKSSDADEAEARKEFRREEKILYGMVNNNKVLRGIINQERRMSATTASKELRKQFNQKYRDLQKLDAAILKAEKSRSKADVDAAFKLGEKVGLAKGDAALYNQKNADKAATEKKIAELKKAHRKAISELKQDRDNRLDELRKEKNKKLSDLRKSLQAEKEAAVKNVRKNRDESLKKQRDHFADVRENERERKRESNIRKKINNMIADFEKRLSHPTENHYIPAKHVAATIALLEVINTDNWQAEQRLKEIDEQIKNLDKNSKTYSEDLSELIRKREFYEKRDEAFREKAAALKAIYDGYKNDLTYARVYDKSVADMLNDLIVTVGETPVKQMNEVQLTKVYNAIKAMDTVIKNSIILKMQDENRSAFEVARELIRETNESHVITKDFKSKLKKFGLDMVNPKDVFERLGGFAKNSMWLKMYNVLNDGQLKRTAITMDLSRGFADLLDVKNQDKLLAFQGRTKWNKLDTSKLYDIGLKDEDGNVIKVTADIAAGIYLDTFNERNGKHLAEGGKIIPNLDDYYKNNGGFGYGQKHAMGFSVELSKLGHELAIAKGELGDAKSQTKVDPARVADIERKIKDLKAEIGDVKQQSQDYLLSIRAKIEKQFGKDDYFQKWIKATRQLMNEDSKRYLNETTMEVYGIEKASEPDYFPIKTAANFRSANFDTVTSDMSLENVGFMKERINGANPSLALGIADVVNSQISNVAQYCGLMPAIKEFEKAYGKVEAGYSDSVQNALSTKTDNYGNEYINNLMGSITGSRKSEKNPINTFLASVRGHVAQTSLTLNPRVALSQGASLPTAGAILGMDAVNRALFSREEIDTSLIAKYSPLWWYRMQGYSTTELGDIKNSNDMLARLWKKARWATGWIQGVDGWATKKLWLASEYYVQDKLKLKKGSNGYYEEVARIYNRVIEETQPNYTVMQRPEILRNPSDMMKSLTMFMTQRLQNLSIMYGAVERYRKYSEDLSNKANGITTEDVTQARNDMFLALGSQVASAATIVGLKLLVNMLMSTMNPYRDEDDELSVGSVALELGDQFIDTMVGNIWLGSNVYSLMKAMAGRESFSAVAVGGIETLNDFAESITKLTSYLATTDDVKSEEVLRKLKDVIMDGTTVVGLPVNNAVKIYKAFEYAVKDISNGELWEASVERSKKTETRRLYAAMIEGDDARIAELTEVLEGESKANSRVKSYMKTEFTKDRLTDKDAIEQLVKFFGMEKNKAEELVLYWELLKEHPNYSKIITQQNYTKYRTYVEKTGLSIEKYTDALKKANADGKGLKKDELKSYLDKLVSAGAMTRAQANAVYATRGWKS